MPVYAIFTNEELAALDERIEHHTIMNICAVDFENRQIPYSPYSPYSYAC